MFFVNHSHIGVLCAVEWKRDRKATTCLAVEELRGGVRAVAAAQGQEEDGPGTGFRRGRGI